jgi:peptide/nickel transport system permease protein
MSRLGAAFLLLRQLTLLDRITILLVLGYFVAALGTWLGVWGAGWDRISALPHRGPSADHWFGTNAIGQDILARALSSSATAIEVGVVVAALSSVLGLILGGIAGYWSGGWIDRLVVWLAGVLDAVPFLLFVAAMAWALRESAFAMHLAMIICFWTTTARLVRAEVIRLKPQGFVESATALGLPDLQILARHLLPNTYHVALVQASILMVAAVKTEVILSFLGMGIHSGVSWGVMISESAQDVLAGHFKNFLVASFGLSVMVLAFNQLVDVIQDHLDPKQHGA